MTREGELARALEDLRALPGKRAELGRHARERAAVVRLRLANADEALSDAQVLLDRGSLRGATNRTYYGRL